MHEKTPLPYISEELLLDILCRLPIKSLVRFRCVCRSWRSLLSNDPVFATRYRSNNPDTYGYLLKYQTRVSDSYNFALINDSDTKFRDTVDDSKVLTVIGSADGVVCYVRDNGQFVLWNPSTRDSYLVPCSIISEDLFNKSYFGFARFDHNSVFGGSFSIVRIVRNNCTHHWTNGDPYCCTPQFEAEFYNSSHNKWTKIGHAPKNVLICTDECSVTVGGTSYWCTYTWCASIISFNHSLCTFSEFDGPGPRLENSSLDWNLGEIFGSLVALIHNTDGGVDAWKMVGDDSGGGRVVWVRQYCIASPDGVGKVVKCLGNGEFLLATTTTTIIGHSNEFMTKLSLYNPWSKNGRLIRELQVEKINIYDVFLYVKTMISPRAGIMCT